MSNYRDRIKEKAKETGFQEHPIGTFPAEVVGVEEREWEGRPIIEVKFKTSVGRTKIGLWVVRATDIDGRLLERSKDRQEAEDRYVGTMARVERLYRDLGLPPPEGNDDVEYENAAWGRLGELKGRACEVVIKAGKVRPDGSVSDQIVFINAPKGARPASVTATPTPLPASAFAGAEPQNLDDVPF